MHIASIQSLRYSIRSGVPLPFPSTPPIPYNTPYRTTVPTKPTLTAAYKNQNPGPRKKLRLANAGESLVISSRTLDQTSPLPTSHPTRGHHSKHKSRLIDQPKGAHHPMRPSPFTLYVMSADYRPCCSLRNATTSQRSCSVSSIRNSGIGQAAWPTHRSLSYVGSSSFGTRTVKPVFPP